MKKIGEKIITSIITCIMLLTISTSSVFAAVTNNIATIGVPPISEAIIYPGVPDGYSYVPGGRTIGLKKVGWTHDASNTVGEDPDLVTFTVQREKSVTFTGTAEASFKVMAVDAKVSAEVAIGSTRTTSWSATFSIPAHTTNVICEAGSLYASAYGKEYYIQDERLLSTKSVTGKWTYTSYTSKHQ